MEGAGARIGKGKGRGEEGIEREELILPPSVSTRPTSTTTYLHSSCDPFLSAELEEAPLKLLSSSKKTFRLVPGQPHYPALSRSWPLATQSPSEPNITGLQGPTVLSPGIHMWSIHVSASHSHYPDPGHHHFSSQDHHTFSWLPNFHPTNHSPFSNSSQREHIKTCIRVSHTSD